MQIEEYISELLFEHDCVIIPDFGGFIGNYSPSQIDPVKHLLEPPRKKILFNKGLTQNDGLLANHLCKREKISYSQALNEISKAVKNYQSAIKQSKRASLDNIGVLYTDEQGNLLFQQDEKINYLPGSFGLSAFYHLPAVKDGAEESKVVELYPKKINHVRTYAAAAAIGAVIASAFWISLNQNRLGIDYSSFNIAGKKDIRQYSFTQREPLPATPNVKDSTAIALPKPITSNIETGNYHIIAGCFRSKENAETLIKRMQGQNMNAAIIGTTLNGLYMVGYGKFNTREEAETNVANFRKNFEADAWVFEKPKI